MSHLVRLTVCSVVSFVVLVSAVTHEVRAQERSGSTSLPRSGVTPAHERPLRTLADLNNAFIEVAEEITPSVVTVFTEQVMGTRRPGQFGSPFEQFFHAPEQNNRRRGLGSGIIMSSDGLILTNNHVVENADSIFVRDADGRTHRARVVGLDPKTDIAVLKIQATGLRAVRTGNSDNLKVGEIVMAVGSPLSGNLAHTVTSGIVSAVGRSNVGLADYEDFIQTDAAINPGNSGGALINLNGELVGINAAIASRSGGFEGIGFAVPVNMATRVMESLREHGKVVRGWLGVDIQGISEEVARVMNLSTTEGALVSNVYPGTPAEKAGLQAEDVIVRLNDDDVRTSPQLRNMIAGTPPGTTVTLDLVRNGQRESVPVKLGELPTDNTPIASNPASLELGFQVTALTPEVLTDYALDPDERGVLVVRVDENSNAYESGLRVGDIIREVNRQSVSSIRGFDSAVSSIAKSENVLLRVAREGSAYFIAFSR